MTEEIIRQEVLKEVFEKIDMVNNKFCLDTDDDNEHCKNKPLCDCCDILDELRLELKQSLGGK